MVYDFFGARICGDRWHRQQRDDHRNHEQPPEFHRERYYRMKAPMANGKSAAVEAQLDEPSAKLF
jgi:hypothetical protein